jgi:hypothetical protein
MLLLMSVGSWTFHMFQCSAIPSWGVGREDGVVRCFVVTDGVEIGRHVGVMARMGLRGSLKWSGRIHLGSIHSRGGWR